jgi:predicted O-methyltransferase YrrM
MKMISKFREFINPLNVTPSGELNENWHEHFIEYLAKVVHPNVYVELGLYRCSLFNLIIPYANELIGVDINPDAEKYLKKSEKVTFYSMDTSKFAEKLKLEPILIDMLFIDADHSKEAVINDFTNFFPFVKQHGLIMIHDTHPKSEEFLSQEWCNNSYQAIEDLSINTDNYELVTIPVHPGLTLIRKRVAQLSWKEKAN